MTTVGARAARAAVALQPFGLTLMVGRDSFVIARDPDNPHDGACYGSIEQVEKFIAHRQRDAAKGLARGMSVSATRADEVSEAVSRQPRVCDLVHYVSHGTPLLPDGTQAFPSICRAAMVTEVTGDTAGLMVVNPAGQFFNQGVAYDGGTFTGPERQAQAGEPLPPVTCADLTFEGGTWHWPGDR
jgi:hypothetical protein